jgi:hypothetical protein
MCSLTKLKFAFHIYWSAGRRFDIDDKLDKLIETMEECISRIEREENTDLVKIIKLYM